MRALALIAALGALAPAMAHAREDGPNACEAQLEQPREVTVTFIDPLTTPLAAEPFVLRLRDISDEDCRFSLSFDDVQSPRGLAGDHPNERLDYRIALDAAGANVIFDSRHPNSQRPDTRGDRALFDRDGRLALFLIVDAGQRPRAGHYGVTNTIIIRSLGGNDHADEADLALSAVIPPQVQAFFVGAPGGQGGYTMLDLGELSTGDIGRATLRVFTTSDVDFTISSEHGGQLANQNGEGGVVSYELMAGSRRVDLGHEGASGGWDVRGAGHGESRRFDLPLELRVGDVSRAPAGEYRDRITIVVSAR